MEIPAFAKPVMFNQKRKIMVQTKEMKNYKTEVADNNRIEYLHFFGIKYPFIEIDGMKIASDELEYAIRNHPNSPEGFELMEETDCFLPEKELLRLDEKQSGCICLPEQEIQTLTPT